MIAMFFGVFFGGGGGGSGGPYKSNKKLLCFFACQVFILDQSDCAFNFKVIKRLYKLCSLWI